MKMSKDVVTKQAHEEGVKHLSVIASVPVSGLGEIFSADVQAGEHG